MRSSWAFEKSCLDRPGECLPFFRRTAILGCSSDLITISYKKLNVQEQHPGRSFSMLSLLGSKVMAG
ncbi:unnamed protein product [Eretmochelys imbricata]